MDIRQRKETIGVDIMSPATINKVAKLINDGASIDEVRAKAGLEIDSIGRYLRWAKADGLLPQDVKMRGDVFVLDGERYGKHVASHQDMMTAVIFNDLHCPFQDDRAIELMCKVIEDIGPDITYENGDGLDCYTFSKFSRNPARAKSFQEERNIHRVCMQTIHSASNAEYHYIGAEDNHYARFIRNVLWEIGLNDVPELSAARILYLDDNRYHADPVIINGTFRIAHGARFGMYAHKATLLDHMISGMMGHTHRMGSFFHSTPSADYVYYMNGHLSNSGATYGYYHDWTQGFSIATFAPDGRFFIQQVPIKDHETVVNGKVYKT